VFYKDDFAGIITLYQNQGLVQRHSLGGVVGKYFVIKKHQK